MIQKARFGISIFILLSSTMCAVAEIWKFGIISDTQWSTLFDTGNNPNSVAVGIINQVNREFVDHEVKFVVATGDLTDNGTEKALDTRCTFAQELYNNGIGFYPIRGNHEASAKAAAEFIRIFPQTVDGVQNKTPQNAFVYGDSSKTHPVRPVGGTFSIGSGFSGPSADAKGLSYAFNYKNAVFVLLDQFTSPAGITLNVKDQLPWIENVISSRQDSTHAFIISHKGLITPNHPDGLFGSNPAEDPVSTNKLISMMFNHNVRYLINGHDHLHNRSLVFASDKSGKRIEEITLTSDSYKYYEPESQSNDDRYNFPAFGYRCEIPIAQHCFNIGYYIVTVDSLAVTVDYYGVNTSNVLGSLLSTPLLKGKWKKQERFGYSLNGKEFLIPKDSLYTKVTDTFDGTIMKILDGVNTKSGKDASNRYFTQVVSSGWNNRNSELHKELASHIVTLRGMHYKMENTLTEPYALSISYSNIFSKNEIMAGNAGIVTKRENGLWENAVGLISGGQKRFVNGPWEKGYLPGSYGVDTLTKSAWAVVDYNGDFAVASLGTTNIKTLSRTETPAFVVSKGMLRFTEALNGGEIVCEFFTLSGRHVFSIKSNGTPISLRDLRNESGNGNLLMKWSYKNQSGKCMISVF